MENTGKQDNYYTVVECGTEIIKVLIGSVDEYGRITVLGYGYTLANFQGKEENFAAAIRKGEILDAVKISRQLQAAKEEAENMAGINTADTNLYMGITGRLIFTQNNSACIRITGHGGIVSQEDMERALKTAVEMNQTRNATAIHSFSRYYELDNGLESGNVIGLAAGKLTAHIQCVMLDNRYLNVLSKQVDTVFGKRSKPLYIPLCLPYATIPAAEIDSGSLNLDLGAGLVSFCVPKATAFVHTGHLPIGCNHIENDIMQAFDIPLALARKILRKMPSEDFIINHLPASVMNTNDGRDRMITMKYKNSGNTRHLPLSSIEAVIRLRLEEIFSLVRRELELKDAWRHINGRVHLSGGGALIPGAVELACQVFRKEVRIARLTDIFSADDYLRNDPRYITPMGLLKLAKIDKDVIDYTNSSREESGGFAAFFQKAISAIKESW